MIEEVEIEWATDKFVVLPNGREEAMDSDWQWYRRDREQAKQAMIYQHQREVDRAKGDLDSAEKRLAKARNA